jgi:ATP-dependent DNA helicase RecG
VKIILYVQEKGQIGNSEVQEICNVSKRTASNYLAELEKDYLDKKGATGKGTYYVLKGQ